MKQILINASHPEEVRIALVDGQQLFDLSVEHKTREQKKANIYKGRVMRVEPSLEAAFVDFGAERHGFLPLKDIAQEHFSSQPQNGNRVKIQDVIKEGDELIVQVDKEERGGKGAALTTFISLPGRYQVLMPNNPRASGISRRIENMDRKDLREIFAQLQVPEGMGVIIRTAGIGRPAEELQKDLDSQISLWENIKTASAEVPAPMLIIQESNAVIRAIRDNLREDIQKVLIDSPSIYQQTKDFVKKIAPQFESRILLYEEEGSLFTKYQIEGQIEAAYKRQVKLPSGGHIVIDVTEALVSIDVNSGQSTGGEDINETALKNNVEAAQEVARQLRLRDLGGLIVIDFIDMSSKQHQTQVEEELNKSLAVDRARIQTTHISRFGLLEMSRQRLNPSLEETSHTTCPRCKGSGVIRDQKSLALSMLRQIQAELQKENTQGICVTAPVEIATYLLNEKRRDINLIEQRYGARVVIIPLPHLESPHYEFTPLSNSEAENAAVSSGQRYLERQHANQKNTKSKMLAEAEKTQSIEQRSLLPSSGASKTDAPAQRKGLFGKLKSIFSSDQETQAVAQAHKAAKSPARRGQRNAQEKTDKNERKTGNRRGRQDGQSRSRQRASGKKNNGRSQQSAQRQGSEAQGRERQRKRTDNDKGRNEESAHQEQREPTINDTKKEPAPRRRGPDDGKAKSPAPRRREPLEVEGSVATANTVPRATRNDAGIQQADSGRVPPAGDSSKLDAPDKSKSALAPVSLTPAKHTGQPMEAEPNKQTAAATEQALTSQPQRAANDPRSLSQENKK